MKSPQEILNKFKIVPTEHRLELLKLILDHGPEPFTQQELEERVQTLDIAFSSSTIFTTLLLFVSRRLLKSYPAPNTEKRRGRPTTLYAVESSLLG
ncbi:MAG: hypothetical protein WDN75_10075 [Bacteroidota bacterium]